MCGIIGYAGNQPCMQILLNGLEKLEYRGYDSAGVAVMVSDKISIFKENGPLSVLRDSVQSQIHLEATVGIGHTRWATHGKPSKENAHPHRSNNGKFALVHNGIIENESELRLYLAEKGYHFRSQTDSEVVAVLLEDNDNGNVLETIQQTIHMLRGSFALAILCETQPDNLFCVRRAAPLWIGVGKQENLIASDILPLLPFTQRVYTLSDGEIACLTAERIWIYNECLKPICKQIKTVTWNAEKAGKDGNNHFMQKEIVEQPNAVAETIAAYLRQNRVCFPQINLSQTEICQFNQIRIIACGSAYHVGLAAKYILEALLQIPVEVDYASEFRYRSPIIDSHTLFVAISQSGETADTLAALRLANNRGIFTLAVVNVTGSSIAMESQSVLYTHAGPEIAVATTKAYSAQLVILYMLGLYFGEIRRTVTESQYNELIEALNALPKHIETVLQRERLLRDLAKQLAPLHDIYFMGRNLDYAVALEGALKLKEISYIHAEAYPAGELKHGTIALIEENSVVICVACVEEVLEKTIVNIQEVRARGAKVLVITTERNAARIRSECDAVFTVPDGNVLFSASLAVIPMQLLSYHIARLRGCEIDKPRNLAKSVTVE